MSQTLGEPPVTLDERVWAMKFTPDGKNLLTVTDQINRIGWPSKERRTLWQQQGEETMMSATFSPDGTHFANSNNGDKVYVHETTTGKLLHTFKGRDPRFTATAWSPDGGRLAVGADHEVVIYDVKTGEARRRFTFGDSDIAALAWSPDDQWIAAATEHPNKGGHSVFLRSLRGNAAPLALPGSRDVIFSFSPDSTTLAVSCEESLGENHSRDALYFWDIAKAKEIYRQPHNYNNIVHSPDGRWLAACGLNTLLILDARTGREVQRLQGDSINTHVWSAAFSPDGKILAAGIEDRVRFRETTTWKEMDADDVLRAPVSTLAFTGDGRHLVTGSWNGDLVLWDWEKKVPVWKRPVQSDEWEIKSLSIDPTSRWIGVAQTSPKESRQVRLVDFATGETVRFVEVPGMMNTAPLFHPTRRTAYIATRDHELVEWDCETGQILRKLPVPFLRTTEAGRIHGIDALSFDPITPEVICWSAGNQACGRIHLGTGVESLTFETRFIRPDSDPIPPRDHDFAAIGSFVWNFPMFHQATPRENIEWRPSVRHPSDLLQLSAKGSIVTVFDILSQSFIHSFDFGPGEIKAIALSPDGRTLVAATTGGLRYHSLDSAAQVAAGTTPETLWRLMGGSNHWQSYLASWALARQPECLRFLESQLPPAREPTAEEIAQLKSRLADSDHTVRQTAAREWLDLGQNLDKETYETLREGGLPEKWPSDFALKADLLTMGVHHVPPIPLLTPLSDHRRAMRAVMLLKADRSEASRRLLERLASGHPGAPLTKAAVKARASQR